MPESIFDQLKRQAKKQPGKEQPKEQVPKPEPVKPSLDQIIPEQKPAPEKKPVSHDLVVEQRKFEPKPELQKPIGEKRGFFGFIKKKPSRPEPVKPALATVGEAFGSKRVSNAAGNLSPKPMREDRTDDLISAVSRGRDEPKTKPIIKKPEPKLVPEPELKSSQAALSWKPDKVKVDGKKSKVLKKKPSESEIHSLKEHTPEARKVDVPSDGPETDASIAREMFDNKVKKTTLRKEENSILNILVVIFILVGIIILAYIWMNYFAG